MSQAMKYLVKCAVVASSVLMIAACSGTSTSTEGGGDGNNGAKTTAKESVVELNGRTFTCEHITASDENCSSLTQATFDVNKERIDAFVNSGSLGMLVGMKANRLAHTNTSYSTHYIR